LLWLGVIIIVRLLIVLRCSFTSGKRTENSPDNPNCEDGEEEFLHTAKVISKNELEN
jgi:hypothetical protein